MTLTGSVGFGSVFTNRCVSLSSIRDDPKVLRTNLAPRGEGGEVTANLQGESAESAKCSFCGKNQRQVEKLIAGPSVFICSECVDLCIDIISEEMPAPPPLATALEDVRRRLVELGTEAGELTKQINRLARWPDDSQ
jgi:hypothetical protein